MDLCEAMEDECCDCCLLGRRTREALGEPGCDLLAVNTQGECREVFLDCCFDRISEFHCTVIIPPSTISPIRANHPILVGMMNRPFAIMNGVNNTRTCTINFSLNV